MIELEHRLDEMVSMLEELQCSPSEYYEVAIALSEASGIVKEGSWKCPNCGFVHCAHNVLMYCPRCLEMAPMCARCVFGDCAKCRAGNEHSERAAWWKGDDMAFDDFDLRYFRLTWDRILMGDDMFDALVDDADGRNEDAVEFGCDHFIDVSLYPETAAESETNEDV